MPSSDDIVAAHNEVRLWAIEQLKKEGHPQKSAEEIIKYMPYAERIKLAEKYHGPIYQGPYSPY